MRQPILLTLICFFITILSCGLSGYAQSSLEKAAAKPNILWLYVEDMSPNLSCYGETTIQTPQIDRLAEQGRIRAVMVYLKPLLVATG